MKMKVPGHDAPELLFIVAARRGGNGGVGLSRRYIYIR